MRILAIETSCDETAISIAEFFGSKSKPRINVLSNIVSSQVKLHAKYGGVVPNLAKREHQRNLVPILLKALREAELLKVPGIKTRKILNTKYLILNAILEREPELLKTFKKRVAPLAPPKIDAIAVTHGPGLAPALWVGVNFAKALAYFWDKPLMPINHMSGHLYSALLQQKPNRIINDKLLITKNKQHHSSFVIRHLSLPAIALLVSGGHTELVLMRGHGKFKIVGETLDDAAGEAFDKVARILGLGYPGGPEISKLAKKGNADKYPLPKPMINTKDYNFSFSGLKTAVLYLVRDTPKLMKADVAASFQKSAIEVLVKKTIRAAKEYKVKTILLGGGVAANKLLRQKLFEACRKELSHVTCRMSHAALTGDNALMIAVAAFFVGKKRAPTMVEANANLRL